MQELTSERWQQVKNLLCDALEFDSETDRLTYVARQCGDDVVLRREVESLLKSFPDHIEAFAENVRDTLGRAADGSPIGGRLGAYRVVREIGRGGMGTVYLAERADGQFQKQVAIKVLKRGIDTEEIVGRFQAERQILAKLEHPNIARLIDAGTTANGLPYFIMEYVDGLPVSQFVTDKSLPVPARLELFLKICAAVEFAHENEVVHRDLKPSNILVTARGEPKLLDFGIAKLVASSGGDEITAIDQQRLTANYAAPEQVAGEPVNFQTDVYALGAVLYEILCGSKPYEFSGSNPPLEEVRRVLRRRGPAPPSTHANSDPKIPQQLKGDLDNITLLAMRGRRDDRYASVKAMASDVRRYLLGQRTLARRPNRTALLAGIAVLLVVAALSIYYLQALRAKNAKSAMLVALPNKSVAVLPFQNLSSDSENRLFAVAIQEEILSELAKVADLKVISRTSVVRYDAGQPRDLQRIGESLGVAHILEGSIQRVGNRVRVNGRLTDTRTGTQLWAEVYDRELSDVFMIESEVAQAITRQLRAKLSAQEKAAIEERPTADLNAYDLYLRGQRVVDSYLDLEDPKGSLLEAIKLLESATARDPGFALAFAAAGRAHDLLYFLELDLDPNRVRLAEAAVKNALRLRPDSGEVHLALADHYFRCYHDYARALQELASAEPKLPNNVSFFLLRGYIERRQGLWNEATRSFSKAVELDPANINAVNLLADHYVLLRRFAEATRTYQRAIRAGLYSPALHFRVAWTSFGSTGEISELEQALSSGPPNLDVAGGATPWRILVALVRRDYDKAERVLADSPRQDFQNVDYSFYYPRAWYEAIIARSRGDQDSARNAFARARAVLLDRLKVRPFDPRILGLLSEMDAGLGDKELAIREGKQAVELMPLTRDSYDGALVLQNLAQTYAWTGEKDLAFELIEKLLSVPGYVSYGFLRVDPAWDPLRNDPKFQTVLARAKQVEP